ncbi:hypothetical protein DYQ86_14405 [Acidobacteria bacterium AB60]|nr:hypothetical protein DYQ86_14405 [Acidobacteria bacterium AB60]
MHSVSSDFPGGKIRGTGRTVLGFPLRGFGLFTSLLLSFASALLTFCLVTMISIFSLLVWNLGGRHAVDYAISYRDFGLPASLIVLAIALPFFLVLWIRGKIHE